MYEGLPREIRSPFHGGGVQPISWIEADIADLRGEEALKHGLEDKGEPTEAILTWDLNQYGGKSGFGVRFSGEAEGRSLTKGASRGLTAHQSSKFKGLLVKTARAGKILLIGALLFLTSCGNRGTGPQVDQPADTNPVTIERLACLTSELVNQVREDISNIMLSYESCRDELVDMTYNLQLSEDHLKGVFGMMVAHAFAPYGSSSATTWEELLEEDELNCYNYTILAGYLIEELGLPENSYCIVGFDGGAVGNHAQSFLASEAKEILLDPTIGLVADIDIVSLLAGEKVPPDKMVLMYAYNDPAILLFAEKIVDAVENGKYEPSDVIYGY